MADRDTSNKIIFHYLQLAPSLRNRKKLKRFISTIFVREGKALSSLNIIFCSDKYLLKVNQRHLHHNDFTDVITFNLSGKDASIVAEIYISLDRVRENAQIFQQTLPMELNRVIFHGILHLCGYNDKTAPAVHRMRAKENFYLRKFSQYVSRDLRST